MTPVIEGQTYDRVKNAGGSMDADSQTTASHFEGQGCQRRTELAQRRRLRPHHVDAAAEPIFLSMRVSWIIAGVCVVLTLYLFVLSAM